MHVHAPAVCAEGTGARTDTVEPRAGPAGLGKLLSSTSSRGVKILRQTLEVNCQMMSSTSAGCLRFPRLSRPSLFICGPRRCVAACCYSRPATVRFSALLYFIWREGIKRRRRFLIPQPGAARGPPRRLKLPLKYDVSCQISFPE